MCQKSPKRDAFSLFQSGTPFPWWKSLIHIISRCKEGEKHASAVSKVHHGEKAKNKKTTPRQTHKHPKNGATNTFKIQISDSNRAKNTRKVVSGAAHRDNWHSSIPQRDTNVNISKFAFPASFFRRTQSERQDVLIHARNKQKPQIAQFPRFCSYCFFLKAQTHSFAIATASTTPPLSLLVVAPIHCSFDSNTANIIILWTRWLWMKSVPETKICALPLQSLVKSLALLLL